MSIRVHALTGLIFVMCFMNQQAAAQRPGINQDEAKVPSFTLPEVLKSNDGSRVETVEAWESIRRLEVFDAMAKNIYGHVPEREVNVDFRVVSSWEILNGSATRKEVKVIFGDDEECFATLLVTLPKSRSQVPCFLGYNFHGNHTTTDDPKVAITKSWVRDRKSPTTSGNRANEEGRGTSASRWPYRDIVEAGYGVATVYYGDVDPDIHDKFKNGIHPLFYESGQTKPKKSEWGSIGAWAWALSRCLDYLNEDSGVDGNHVAVIGHSRLGKTSLWAGASDERFWMTISNNSGCGGAALNRRKFGETVAVINRSFPHWFCDRFPEFNDREVDLPVDQHMLMALIAPRAVYVASATGDRWADPRGEYLSLYHSNAVFELYRDSALQYASPAADEPRRTQLRGYHLRTGKHDITSYDWEQYIKFGDFQLEKSRGDFKK
ncbi:MAG: glucuronyl esterase domain-containing protein [Pirellulales bacterium]|jgi:hypothetical protein